jgi:hypothetical protein
MRGVCRSRGDEGGAGGIPGREGTGGDFKAITGEGCSGVLKGEGSRARGPSPLGVGEGKRDAMLLYVAHGLFFGRTGNVSSDAKVREGKSVE